MGNDMIFSYAPSTFSLDKATTATELIFDYPASISNPDQLTVEESLYIRTVRDVLFCDQRPRAMRELPLAHYTGLIIIITARTGIYLMSLQMSLTSG